MNWRGRNELERRGQLYAWRSSEAGHQGLAFPICHLNMGLEVLCVKTPFNPGAVVESSAANNNLLLKEK